MKKKDIDSANVQGPSVNEEDVDAVAVIQGMFFGASGPKYYREKLGWTAEGAEIDTSLAAKERTSVSHVDCKG